MPEVVKNELLYEILESIKGRSLSRTLSARRFHGRSFGRSRVNVRQFTQRGGSFECTPDERTAVGFSGVCRRLLRDYVGWRTARRSLALPALSRVTGLLRQEATSRSIIRFMVLLFGVDSDEVRLIYDPTHRRSGRAFPTPLWDFWGC